MSMNRAGTYRPRPFGGGHKRKLPAPDERTLRDMSLLDLEDLAAKIQTVINRKRKLDTLGYNKTKVYSELVVLLEGKTTAGGLLLTTEIINSLEPKDLQFLQLSDHELEMKVFAALKPFRNKEGKLKV